MYFSWYWKLPTTDKTSAEAFLEGFATEESFEKFKYHLQDIINRQQINTKSSIYGQNVSQVEPGIHEIEESHNGVLIAFFVVTSLLSCIPTYLFISKLRRNQKLSNVPLAVN